MAHDSTQLELEDLVGDGTQEPEVVLDQEHRQPVGLQAEQNRFEAVEVCRARAGRRLIEKEDGRIRRQRRGDHQSLLFGARELGGRPACLCGQADTLTDTLNALRAGIGNIEVLGIKLPIGGLPGALTEFTCQP